MLSAHEREDIRHLAENPTEREQIRQIVEDADLDEMAREPHGSYRYLCRLRGSRRPVFTHDRVGKVLRALPGEEGP